MNIDEFDQIDDASENENEGLCPDCGTEYIEYEGGKVAECPNRGFTEA